MQIRPRFTYACINPICVAAALCLAPLARAQAAETITATANVKTSGGVSSTAPVTVTVDRFSTDRERDEVLAALKKGGTDAVYSVLLVRSAIGTVRVGNNATAIKYVYERTTPNGRLITAVTSLAIGFVGAGAPGAQPKSGNYLGLVILEVAKPGPGQGELVPATKLRLNEQGAIVTDGYSDDVVRLSNVVGK
jgi:hypothetical protein